jgi:hypothetical protein
VASQGRLWRNLTPAQIRARLIGAELAVEASPAVGATA